VDLAEGIFDQAAGLVPRIERELVERGARREVDGDDAISVRIRDDGAIAVLRDQHRAAADRLAEWFRGGTVAGASAGSGEERERKESLQERQVPPPRDGRSW
jgi:hypothetical protein